MDSVSNVKLNTGPPDSDTAVKYNSRNPVIKWLVRNFVSSFNDLLTAAGKEGISNILEVGAGEGFMSALLAVNYPNSSIISSDISELEYETRKNNLAQYKNVQVIKADGRALPFGNEHFDLVLCSEVLEHIAPPEAGIYEMRRVCKQYSIFSVPNEPLWSILNMSRGKYWSTLGNTPGHINSWSPWSFRNFVRSSGYEIIAKSSPLPWTMALARKIKE